MMGVKSPHKSTRIPLQVCALKTVKQSLAQALQKSKDEKEKAVKEARAMAERLQTAKRTIHVSY